MKVYLVERPAHEWCQDYAMVIIAEDESFDKKKIEEQTVTWIKLGLALSEEEKEELMKLCEQYTRL